VRWPWQKRAPEALALPAGAELPSRSAATPPAGVPPTPADIAKAAAYGGGGGFTPSAAVPGPTKAAGADGVAIYGGFLISGERDRRLIGEEKWRTYDNAILNVAIIASAVNVWTALGGSAKWTAEPNARGGKDALRAADLVTEGLLEAQISKPWRAVVRKQLMKKFRGFALHEMLVRRRGDGKVVCGDLQDRPQATIWRWNKPDEQSAWIGVEQLTRTGATPYIPRERLFYSVEDTLTSSPDGVGLLRQLAEPVRILELYQQWEGIGFQTDLRGMPSARAPLSKLAQQAESAGAKTPTEITNYILSQTKFLVDFLAGHNKRPDQGLLLDSITYTSKDQAQSPSAVAEWAFDLVRGAVSGMPEVGTAIGRITRDIARVMQAEWLLLGGEDSGGAYSMHEDKTAMFGLVVNAALEDIADDGTRDCAARIVGLNGLDVETCTPKLVPEPIATAAVESACRSLLLMYQAALNPADPAINVLRGRLSLPRAPEIDTKDWVLPRGATLDTIGAGGGPKPTTPGAGLKPAGAPTAAAPGQAGNMNARPDGAQPAPAPEKGKA